MNPQLCVKIPPFFYHEKTPAKKEILKNGTNKGQTIVTQWRHGLFIDLWLFEIGIEFTI